MVYLCEFVGLAFLIYVLAAETIHPLRMRRKADRAALLAPKAERESIKRRFRLLI